MRPRAKTRGNQLSFQDQDSVGGGFKADEAFSGILQNLYVLRGELTEDDVMSIYKMTRGADLRFIEFPGNYFIVQQGDLSENGR